MAGFYDDYGNWVPDDTPEETPTYGDQPGDYPLPGENYGNEGNRTPTDPPPGAVKQDSLGNWLDVLGNIIQPLTPLLNAVGGRYVDDLLTGGLVSDARNMVKAGGSAISNIKMPDLMAMIPKLQLQVQQGVMTPAQANAAMASMQGQMSPEQYEAVQAVMQGRMTPAEAIANEQAASGMKDVVSDQATIGGARKALGQLESIAENRGMTEADRAAFAAFMNQTNSNQAQQRAAQLQQLQMQGNAGSGAELAARLSGIQGGANTNAAAGANMAQAAQARALQAIQAGLTGNTQLNAQLFGQDASKAQAQDLVNQFNAQAKNQIALQNAQMAQQAGLANFNTGNQFALANQQALNQAGQYNAGNRQASNLANFDIANRIAMQNAMNQQGANIANAGFGQQANLANFNTANDINRFNTGIMNEQALMPMGVANQQFQNSLAQQKAAADAQLRGGATLGNMAEAALKRGATTGATTTGGATTQPVTTPTQSGDGKKDYSDKGASLGGAIGSIWGPIGSAVGTVGGKLLGKWFSDEDLKTGKSELSDEDVDHMMANLTGYKYRYRGDKDNPEQTGVMAQDMERGMPNSVVDTPAGKMVQKPEALSQVLAVLANNNQRLRKLEGN